MPPLMLWFMWPALFWAQPVRRVEWQVDGNVIYLQFNR